MKRNLFWILSLLLLVSCLDDKSNYDYKDINDFEKWEVNGVANLERYYTLFPGETIKFDPKVRFSIDTLNPDASYAWYLGSKESMQLLSNDLNYEYKAEQIGQFQIVFSATDNKTGVAFSKKVIITVVTPWRNGWIVLSKGAAGESQISMILSRLQKNTIINAQGKEEVRDTVVYTGQDMNVVPNLGRGPKKVVENFIYSDYTENFELKSEVMVLQQDRCVELDGRDLTPISYAEDEFMGQRPLRFEPEDAVLTWTAKYLLNEDNRMYAATMFVGTDLHSGRYLPDPAFNGKKVKQLLPVYKTTGGFLIVGIGEDNTFFGIMDNARIVDGYASNFTIDVRNYVGSHMELGHNGNVDMSLFKNIDGEYVFHAWETSPSSMYVPGPTYVSILNRGGTYYWHHYRLGAQYPRYKPEDKMVIEESASGALSMISEYNCAALLPWKKLLAIASGNKLHFFDYAKLKEEITGELPTFDSEIVNVAVKDYRLAKHNAHLAVALKSGDVYVFEVKHDVEGQSVELKELYHHGGFGEIVDLKYKFGDGNNPASSSLY